MLSNSDDTNETHPTLLSLNTNIPINRGYTLYISTYCSCCEDLIIQKAHKIELVLQRC